MANVGYTITVDSHSAAALSLIKQRVHLVVAKTLIDLEGAVKRMIRVVGAIDTGAMLNSVDSRMTGEFEGKVVVGAEYAVYIEFGHAIVAWGHVTGGHAPARPFVAPAVSQVEPSFQAAVQAAVTV